MPREASPYQTVDVLGVDPEEARHVDGRQERVRIGKGVRRQRWARTLHDATTRGYCPLEA
jgi:hypothetical protein